MLLRSVPERVAVPPETATPNEEAPLSQPVMAPPVMVTVPLTTDTPMCSFTLPGASGALPVMVLPLTLPPLFIETPTQREASPARRVEFATVTEPAALMP